ncbi:MAG: archaemetzincin family Zn-dependent metalloprotease [Candidatus Bathyarchaeia archaeon]
MKIGILKIGSINSAVTRRVLEGLKKVFPTFEFQIIPEDLAIPKEAYDRMRRQHNSNIILGLIHSYATKSKGFEKFLGIVDVDIYVPGLNFVFGEAECPGKSALISLWRLKPELYGETSNFELLVERAIKEAVHELGHTLGLGHCANPNCVMHFSNSIIETDRKKSFFCSECQINLKGFKS